MGTIYNDIKAVLVMANDELGYNKLKDVMRRLLTKLNKFKIQFI